MSPIVLEDLMAMYLSFRIINLPKDIRITMAFGFVMASHNPRSASTAIVVVLMDRSIEDPGNVTGTDTELGKVPVDMRPWIGGKSKGASPIARDGYDAKVRLVESSLLHPEHHVTCSAIVLHIKS